MKPSPTSKKQTHSGSEFIQWGLQVGLASFPGRPSIPDFRVWWGLRSARKGNRGQQLFPRIKDTAQCFLPFRQHRLRFLISSLWQPMMRVYCPHPREGNRATRDLSRPPWINKSLVPCELETTWDTLLPCGFFTNFLLSTVLWPYTVPSVSGIRTTISSLPSTSS